MGRDHDRRTFLRRSAAAAAAAALGRRWPALAAPTAPTAAEKLVQVQGAGVPADLDRALARALKPLGGMGAFVERGAKVVLKPNMGFATEPQVRATTAPELVAAVVRQVLDCKPAEVLVLDSPMRHPQACRERNGIAAACRELDAELLLPTADRFFVEVDVPKGEQLKKVALLRAVLECDVHIPLPVAKSHMAAGYSGAIKGHMGVIRDRESFHTRLQLDQAIADLATVLPCPLVVLDGLSVMARGGPGGPGELVETKALVAGSDPVAVDAAGVALAPLYGRRIAAGRIKHLKAAADHGVGRLELPAAQVAEIELG